MSKLTKEFKDVFSFILCIITAPFHKIKKQEPATVQGMLEALQQLQVATKANDRKAMIEYIDKIGHFHNNATDEQKAEIDIKLRNLSPKL